MFATYLNLQRRLRKGGGLRKGGAIPMYVYLLTADKYRVILSVLDPRKCEYLKDYSLYFEHAYMTTYLAS